MPPLLAVFFLLMISAGAAPPYLNLTYVRMNSCDDGVFCNGQEYVARDGSCVRTRAPCDDGNECTVDTCNEEAKRCSWRMSTDPSCRGTPNCLQAECVPMCDNKQCGSDGCGGTCGSCPAMWGCSDDGRCLPGPDGSCTSPFDLLSYYDDLQPNGDVIIIGDTTSSVNNQIPPCNTRSYAADHVFRFTLLEPAGLLATVEGRSDYSYDTVLYLMQTCDSNNMASESNHVPYIACVDDTDPPGRRGSRITAMLNPGTYYLIVDGFDKFYKGPYRLTVSFRRNCLPNCEDKSCGSDGCGGFCGSCHGDCVDGKCNATVCIPDCAGRDCGDDKCGGVCGVCSAGNMCNINRICVPVRPCDNMAPVCNGGQGCADNEFCGTDCQCYGLNQPMPDLTVDMDMLRTDIVFTAQEFRPTDCAIQEKCILGSGLRRLLRFSVAIINQGLTPLIPLPVKRHPEIYEYAPCHGHIHFTKFAEYALLSQNGSVVVHGRKQAYCMMDIQQRSEMEGPSFPCDSNYVCSNQGIAPGWADIYSNDIDCQWLDVTDVPAGEYRMWVAVNYYRVFAESSYANNIVSIPITIPHDPRFNN